ncbi:Ada metal-binding domain-containing protein [Pseudarthrobacter sp. PS3-L1]|uniref:DNA-3-methyladenine glycosylase 2 family protein n=1 Tax=Pseudarthrobacter sp. PS3-L1 TaxID=3046207 RepID=UPI0024B9AA2A|nr:Ada metal-binding domain-containing protein [Pseudarthrobacter sp. PS3-L1]MDJ0321948.1 Ada metal-binding domain-containing protein [Pseudarthrobacter sp. PS3-L1]
MDFLQRYRAIDTRDPRFDGQFFTAVRTTGIYCRPSCPARTPKASNVRFYETSAAAHDAGYRACKRCLPEAVPGTPAWNLRSDTAARAMRLISDGALNHEGVGTLAKTLGYSARQLNRILTAELGAGPLSLARAARAQTARTLLVSTQLRFADVAFAAGFSSVRQFNDTMQEVFALTPTALRATTRDRGGTTGTALRLALPFRAPFDPGIFSFLAARCVPGIEVGTSTSYSRALGMRNGPAAFTVSLDPQRASAPLQLAIHTVDLRDLSSLLSRVRRLLDLDADPVAIDAALSIDARLAGTVGGTPGIRMPGAVDPAELLVRAMIGQQITVAAARTSLTAVAVCGQSIKEAAPGLDRLFPTPHQIAETGWEAIRGPQRRIDSIRNAAAMMASGDLAFGYGDTVETLEQKLLPLPGVGPWTVGYAAMRILGAPDVFLANDAAVRNGIKALSTEVTSGRPAGADPEFRLVSPWRSYATLHLWRAAAAPCAPSAPPQPATTRTREKAAQ